MLYGRPDLEWLLECKLNSAARYRRFMSLVLLTNHCGPLKTERLEQILRRSDELFLLDEEAAAILLSETGRVGALKAIERFKEANLGDGDLRFAIVSYPKDGSDMETLLQTARRRLEQAKIGTDSTVISAG